MALIVLAIAAEDMGARGEETFRPTLGSWMAKSARLQSGLGDDRCSEGIESVHIRIRPLTASEFPHAPRHCLDILLSTSSMLQISACALALPRNACDWVTKLEARARDVFTLTLSSCFFHNTDKDKLQTPSAHLESTSTHQP